MFDSDFVLLLQSFQTPWLTALMLAISAFGSEQFLTVAAGCILFAFSFRKGSLLLQMVLWSVLLTTFFKELLDLPRPSEMNPSVETLYPQFSPGLISPTTNPGFPSGHVCSTVVFWGAVMFFFPKKILRISGLTLVVLMPISRTYLGRHFLADVLGGFMLGTIIVLVALILFRHYRNTTPQQKPLTLYLILLPFLLNSIPFFDPHDCGKFFGANIGIYWALQSVVSKESFRIKAGFARFLIALLLYVASYYLLFAAGFLASQNLWFVFLASALPPAISIVGTIEASKRLNLYVPDR